MYKVSLHGGHSGEFCEHARGTLRQTIEAAIAFGYHTFGVSEHAPRVEGRFLYSTERAKGYDVARLEAEFTAYAREVALLADEFAEQLVILRGFEAEVVPEGRAIDLMLGYRDLHDFEFMVGSVHYVREITIDGDRADFDQAVRDCGGFERFVITYYESVAEMVRTLNPEVVGHLDLVRKNAPPNADLATSAIQDAAGDALNAIADSGAILDLNTAGYRKGLGSPYPAPWLVDAAHSRGIGFCFGVDSHGPDEVGAGIEEARQYLVTHGVDQVTALTREEGRSLTKRRYSLVD